MANLTREQIRQYAQGAGFTGEDLNIAVAVALAESGGNSRAYNGVGGDRSYGLWQINMIGDMGPDRRKKFNLKSNEDLFDPATNARVAKGIKDGSGWKAWTTYTRGTYKKHMSGDADVAGDPVTAKPATSEGGIVTGGLNALGQTIFQSVSNIAGVIVALVLIIAAILIMVMQSRTGKSLVKKGVKVL